ncbi:MAG: phosphocholine cytidylyltransferase family protein [Gammaproteobacteria bacterium]|nr:phosphocholine cytidylyltransferase family protein [Gammaproteobacteria bacterium]
MRLRQAVILAAGMGTRLRPIGHQGPKGALALGGESLVGTSIERLRRVGIERITIVTGYQPEFYRALADERPDLICTLHNADFADSGSMYSLYLARAAVKEGFLLLESDLIYEQRALTALLTQPEENLILLSGPTDAGDEVYVETDADRKLRAMSKRRAQLGPLVAGELVGISKISAPLYTRMCEYAGRHFAGGDLHLDYETDALVAAARTLPVHCLAIDDLLWSEIDDESHYRRAQRIERLILAREAEA